MLPELQELQELRGLQELQELRGLPELPELRELPELPELSELPEHSARMQDLRSAARKSLLLPER